MKKSFLVFIIIRNQIAQLKYDPRQAGEQIVIDVIDVRQ